MFVGDTFVYKSTDTFTHGGVLLSTQVSGEDYADEGEVNHYDSNISLQLSEPTKPDYLELGIFFRGTKQSGDMHVFGVHLHTKEGRYIIPNTGTHDADDPVHDLFHEPFQKMLDAYHSMPKEQRADALSNLKGNMTITRSPLGTILKRQVKGANIINDINNKKSVDLDHVDNFDYLLSEFPGGPEDDKDLNDIESSTMRLGLWTQASSLILGTQMFDKPIQHVMRWISKEGMKWNSQSLATYFKTVPVGSERHKDLVKTHWNTACS